MDGLALVELRHRRGVAAVVVDASGAAWLADDVGRGAAAGLKDHEPAVAGFESDVTLTGGRLPPGARRAVVADRAGREHEATCGAGAWLALLPEPVRGEAPVVRFLDGGGGIVAVPLPPGVAVEAVDDADEPCPACGAADWARVVSAPAGRYGSDGAGRPTAAVCRRCGHAEHLGVLFAARCDANQAQEADPRAQRDAHMARQMAAGVRSARFALFALAGRRPVVVGRAGTGDRVDTVTLAFESAAGETMVTTSLDPVAEPPEWLARAALETVLYARDDLGGEGSDTAILLRVNARERTRVRQAAAAAADEVTVLVDGAPERFALVAHDRRFAAAARLEDVTVTIAGAGDPADLALERISPADV